MLRRLTVLLPVAAFLFYLRFTSFDLGWSDNYGFVSLAQRLAHFHFAAPETTLRSLGLEGDGAITTPLAYRWVNGRSVPLYPFGAPALMAPLIWLAGSRGPFLLPPICGALCLVLLYRIGKCVSGRPTGYAAAALAFLSPPLFAFSTVAMSDVAATFFTLLATYLLLQSARCIGFAVLGGLASGAAFLTRPNLLLLLIPASLFLIVRGKPKAILALAGGFAPAALLQLWINWFYYGGPLQSSYGEHVHVFTSTHFLPIVVAYQKWLMQFGTIFQLPFLLWAFLDRRLGSPMKVLTLSWFVLLQSFYGFYPYWSSWLCYRYMMPAQLLLIVFAAHGMVQASRRSRSRAAAGLALAMLVALNLSYEGLFLERNGMHNNKKVWARTAEMAKTLHQQTGDRALIFAYSYAGALRSYEDLKTANLDSDPARSAAVLQSCFGSGIPVYALVDRSPEEITLWSRMPGRDLVVRVAAPEGHDLYRFFPDEPARRAYLSEHNRLVLTLRSTDPLPPYVGKGWDRQKLGDGAYLRSRGHTSVINVSLDPGRRYRIQVRFKALLGDRWPRAAVDLLWNDVQIGVVSAGRDWTTISGDSLPARASGDAITLRYRAEGEASSHVFTVLCDTVTIESVRED